MHRISHDDLKKLIDSITVIRGNAQLVNEISHIKWAQSYLNEIITECDKLISLIDRINKNAGD